MAIVQRFFSTTGAGAADGTSWADRAALFSAGNWSTVITGFNFAGSDSLQCLIGPGSYTCSQRLGSNLFANPPTAANPLLLCGCDGSGNLLAIPNPAWVSAQPAWDASTLPVIATTTNTLTSDLATAHFFLLAFTASGRTSGAVLSAVATLNWCQVTNSTANTSAQAVDSTRMNGCVLKCTGSSYDTVYNDTFGSSISNTRIEGVTGSSGNRRGITSGTSPFAGDRLTVVNCGGEGIVKTSTSTSQRTRLMLSVIANNGSDGLKANSTASQTEYYETEGCMITGNGGWGINGNSNAARWVVIGNRLRDNTSGNITGIGNYPTNLDNYTTDSDDATEYVSAGANGDFRIKYRCAIWGQGYGAGDQPSPVLNRSILPSGLSALG